MTKSDDTTHTQSQWNAKGVMSWQPEQSGYVLSCQQTKTQNALKAIAQDHIQSQGVITNKSSVEL